MTWFKRDDNDIQPTPDHEVRTEGLWTKCPACRKTLWKADLEANLQVCPHCGHHFKISARKRIELLLDPGYELVDLELKSTDPLEFTDLKPYKDRLRQAQHRTGLNDAIINAVGQMTGPHGTQDVVLSVMEFGFIAGSRARSSAKRSPARPTAPSSAASRSSSSRPRAERA
jgi:acetyl-CoA carboxylase carboxyl transferase subunit beta